MLALAWQRGEDPYRLYYGLDEQYRPVGDPDGDPMPPAYWVRVKAFIYACGLFSEENTAKRSRM